MGSKTKGLGQGNRGRSTVVSDNKVRGTPAGVGSCCKTGGKNIEGEEAQGTVKTCEG